MNTQIPLNLLTHPGNWIDHPDRDLASELQLILSTLESKLERAWVALKMFEEQHIKKPLPQDKFNWDLLFLYAEAFIHSLNLIGKLIMALQQQCIKHGGSPAHVVKTEKNAFYRHFPELIGVRDSSAHIDERIQRRAKRKPLAAGGLLVVESLLGNKFTSTMADGTVGSVEVSNQSLLKAQECIQNIINAFSWR